MFETMGLSEFSDCERARENEGRGILAFGSLVLGLRHFRARETSLPPETCPLRGSCSSVSKS